MKSAVVYFSLEGNTHPVAKMIAERAGADLIRLEPEKEYQSSGLGKYFYSLPTKAAIPKSALQK